MKKLMIAAAIVCAAALSHGAAISWYWSSTVYQGYTGGDVAKGVSGTVYLFNANTITQEDFLKAIVGGTAIGSVSGMIDSFATTDGKMATASRQTIGEIDNARTVTGKIGAVRDTGSVAYADVFYATMIGDNVYISDTTSKQLSTTQETKIAGALGTSSKVNNGLASAGYSDAGWYSVVPEPTSGLLLLLGVAGLALRRRRA